MEPETKIETPLGSWRKKEKTKRKNAGRGDDSAVFRNLSQFFKIE
jgi:hypothetical protein